MNPGWRFSKSNFINDDGSLPGVDFRGLTTESLRSITNHFFKSGELTDKSATFWDNRFEKDIELRRVADPAELVTSGAACPFHCCFSGITWNQLELPVLGLFVFQDSVEIDYRMGSEWTPDTVDAFFCLIAHLISIAPEATVVSAEQEGLPFPDRFDEALDHYAPQRKKKAEQAVPPNGP
jgi:hypothetical protein